MSWHPCKEPVCESDGGAIELVVTGRPRDLGGFEVRRVLPSGRRRMVGPFIFFDEMGPATLGPGRGIDVRPHPHIGLATLTWLFDGEILHRDSLGSEQLIRPGAVNWMTAGRGIVHSERSDGPGRERESRLHGIQSWVALPLGMEDGDPAFSHHPADAVPVMQSEGLELRLIAGEAWGERSPVPVHSPMFYLQARLDAGARLGLPGEFEDRAVYVVSGAVEAAGETHGPGTLAVFAAGREAALTASEPSLVMLLGGQPLEGERHIWWNFVASSEARIERAKSDWQAGRFPPVPGDEERIPLPED